MFAGSPYFTLGVPYTQSALVACRDNPIQLINIASPDYQLQQHNSKAIATATVPSVLASFFLIKPETEAYLPALSMVWPWAPGTRFFIGTTNLVAYFDVSRPEPVLRLPTIPSSRHRAKGGGVGMRGTVAALAIQPGASGHGGDGGGISNGCAPENLAPSSSSTSSLVAAGTWTRWLGLYDMTRGGECAAAWNVAEAAAEADVGGSGIVQVVWSPCGRYLVAAERVSGGALVYDVRVTGKLLGWLSGREAHTNQRLLLDVFSGGGGGGAAAAGQEPFELWAGGTDGTVRVWNDVGLRQGALFPAWDSDAHSSPVGSTALHASGSVVATCSGAWETRARSFWWPQSLSRESKTIGATDDCTLKFWGLLDAAHSYETQTLDPVESDDPG